MRSAAECLCPRRAIAATSLGAGRSHNGVSGDANCHLPDTHDRRDQEERGNPACLPLDAWPDSWRRISQESKRLQEGRPIADELRRRDHGACPRPRQRDRQLERDAARSWRQDDHAIGQKHGLFDVVGDEQDRRPLLLPQSRPARLADRSASRHRARRRVRRTGRAPCAAGSCAEMPRAGACRLKAGPDRHCQSHRDRNARAPLLPSARRRAGQPRCLEPQRGVADGGSPGKQQISLLHVGRLAEALRPRSSAHHPVEPCRCPG